MAIRVGDQAPDFMLYSSDKVGVTLSGLQGEHVLILFFPLAFTSTCTKELCMMRDNLHKYHDLKARILGISVDSPQTLAKFREELDLNFTLLSDFNKEASTMYDVLYEEFFPGLRGVSKRAAFLVDAEGVVQYAEVLENSGHLPNFDAIVSKLAELNSLPLPSEQ